MNTEQQLIQVGQLSYLDRVVSASALSCVDEELSNKLDKRTGGIVSGDVGVFGHSMEILSGNYFQSNAVTEGVKNFSYKNSFLQAESVFEAEGKHEDWGGAYTGSMGYCMISVMPASNQVQLCGDISGLAGNLGKKYSWAFASGADSKSLEIQSIDQQTRIVTFKSALPSEIAAAQTSSYEEMIDAFDRDDNAIYCPDDPTIGNIVIHNFYGNHAEGGSVKAIGKYAHAEGRATVADCRYSHAEGDRTFAGRMAAHAEGQVSKAFGYYSHAEGYGTEVTNAAKAAHAEGNTSKAVGEASHAEGRSTEADGNYAHTEGFYSKTAPGKIKGYAFNSTNISVDTANNFYSIALSKVNNNNYDPANFAFRVNDIITIIDDAEFLNYAKITAINKFTKSAQVVLNKNLPFIKLKSAKGYICCLARPRSGAVDVTLGSAHAEGINTVASGTASHAQGVETSAVGIYSFAGGRATYAEGYNSKADGAQTSAIGNYSIAEGLRCRAGEDRSYVWSSFAGEIKTDNGAGTFNVHPDAGISGFFIGENDFVKCVYDAVQVSAEALKELLGITGSDSQLQEINNLADEIMN